MNPLTLVRRTQNINKKEAELGISDEASWHANYKDSAYVFVGGLPYDLTEGDLLAVFAQYGEIVDVNLVREKSTGKSKGFAFVAYEDQRSTTLSVDNLNGAQIAGRTIRVDHVSKYKKKEEEDEETERLKREERGVCRAFQKGECKYGDSCRFSHDEQRAANTGWGPEEDRKSKAAANKFDKGVCRAFQKGDCKYGDSCKFSHDEQRAANTGWGPEEDRKSRAAYTKFDSDSKRSREAPPSRPPTHKQSDNYDGKKTTDIGHKRKEAGCGDQDIGNMPKRSDYGQERDRQTTERRSSRYEPESQKSRNHDSREEMKTRRRRDTESPLRDIQDEKDRDRGKDRERQSLATRDYSSQHRRERDDDDHPRARRGEDYHKSGR